MIKSKTFLLILSLCAVVFTSCEKENDIPDILLDGTAKWRLESLVFPMSNETVLYEAVNIVFAFDKKTVTVSGNDGSFYIKDGTYSYSLIENTNNTQNNTRKSYTMTIGKWEYPCYFKDNKMIFSWAHVDGEVITFTKLGFL